jgi:hypothetical protein
MVWVVVPLPTSLAAVVAKATPPTAARVVATHLEGVAMATSTTMVAIAAVAAMEAMVAAKDVATEVALEVTTPATMMIARSARYVARLGMLLFAAIVASITPSLVRSTR